MVLGAEISLPQPGDWYLKLMSEKWSMAEILGNFVWYSLLRHIWYDALATRPEILHCWFFACACVVSIELKLLPYSWEELLLGKAFESLFPFHDYVVLNCIIYFCFRRERSQRRSDHFVSGKVQSVWTRPNFFNSFIGLSCKHTEVCEVFIDKFTPL